MGGYVSAQEKKGVGTVSTEPVMLILTSPVSPKSKENLQSNGSVMYVLLGSLQSGLLLQLFDVRMYLLAGNRGRKTAIYIQFPFVDRYGIERSRGPNQTYPYRISTGKQEF